MPGAPVPVRDRGAAASSTLRRPETLPPAEIVTALVSVVSRNFGATEDQAVQAVSRAFGVKATSAQLKDAITAILEAAVERGVLVRRDALIEPGPNAPKLTREPQKASVELLIAQGEGEVLEFKETIRWDLRQEQVHKRIEDSSLKTIAAFANYKGGTLLIGVRDDGTVTGLGPDLNTLAGSRDRFDLHLTNLIKDRFSESFRAGCVSVSYAMRLIQNNGRPVTAGKPDLGLVELLRKARLWWNQLQTGQIDIATLARNEAINDSWVSRLVRLNFLAPSIVEAILAGTQPATVNAASLRAADLPVDWNAQKTLFGM